MTALHKAQHGYGAPVQVTRTPRETEYEVVARVTRELQRAAAQSSDFSDLVTALDRNKKMWWIFERDLMSEGNGLPVELRAGLVSLARFVEKHTAKVLAREASSDILIEVNQSIMRGLAGEVS